MKLRNSHNNWTKIRGDASLSSRIILLMGILITSGICLRAWNIHHLSLTYDEVLTGLSFIKSSSIRSYHAALSITTPENLSIFSIIQYYWVQIFGTTILAVRMLPLCMNVLALPLPYLVATRIYGRTAGIVATLCFSLSPLFIWWAQGSRQYSLFALLSLLFVCFMTCFEYTYKKKWLILGLCIAFIFLFVSTTAIFFIASYAFFLIITSRERFISNSLQVLLCFIITLPTFANILSMPNMNETQTGQSFSFFLLRNYLTSALVGNDSMYFNWDIPKPLTAHTHGSFSIWVNYLFIIFFLVVMCWLFWNVIKGVPYLIFANSDKIKNKVAIRINTLLMCLLIGPPTGIVVSAILMQRSILFSRYTMYTWPVLYIVTGGFVAALPQRWLLRGTVIMLISLYAYQLPHFIPTTYRADWLAVGSMIRDHANDDDIVITTGEHLTGEVFDENMRWDGRPFDLAVFRAATLESAFDGTLWYLGNQNKSVPLDDDRSVWLILQQASNPNRSHPELESLLQAVGLSFSSQVFVAGDTLLLYRIGLAHFAPDSLLDDSGLLHSPEVLRGEPYTCDSQLVSTIMAKTKTRMLGYPSDDFLWAFHLITAGHSLMAIEVCNELLERIPGHYLARLARALALADLGQEKEAFDEISLAIEYNHYLVPIFGPFFDAFFGGQPAESVRKEVERVERLGFMVVPPALWALYYNRFFPHRERLPLGLIAVRNSYYWQWKENFHGNMIREDNLNAPAMAHLDYLENLYVFLHGYSWPLSEDMH